MTLKICIFFSLLFVASTAFAKVEVGDVQYVRGILTSQSDGEQAKLVGKGNPLYAGDVLNTGSRGFAVINFIDGTKMTLRPNTKFQIKEVIVEKEKENAFFSLLKGGFRAVTGFISKANSKAFKVQTPVATIGIRGTEFDARLCDTDCQKENKKIKRKAKDESNVIGRIALLRGVASVINEQGKSHLLSVGGAVYERDKIYTRMNSHAVIAFKDKTRVTMSPNSIFKVEEHQFKPEEPAENNAFFSFLKGGMRLVTGAIGKLNRQSFKISSPTATIGIRGTGFDLLCEGTCVSADNALYRPENNSTVAKLLRFFIKPAHAADNNGMFASVWNGAIELQLSTGSLILNNGKAAFLKNGFSKPIVLPNIPIKIQQMGGSSPRPDEVEVKEDMFGGVEQKDVKPGLYVNVREGDVQVNNNDGGVIDLGKGESGLSTKTGTTARLKFVPAFQKFDSTPDPAKFTPEMESVVNLLGLKDEAGGEFECTIQ